VISISRTRAENLFAAIEKSQQKVLTTQEETALKIRENTARLKALRLAAEAMKLADGTQKKFTIKKRVAALS